MRYLDFIDKLEHQPSSKNFNQIFIRGDWIYKGSEKLVQYNKDNGPNCLGYRITSVSTQDIVDTMDLLGCSNEDIETALFILGRTDR